MNTFTILFLCVVALCIGVAIGSMIERAMKKSSTVRPPSMPVKDSHAEAGDVEVFCAWRTLKNQVWLEMDGKRLDNKEALQPEQRQRLLNLVLDLRPWLDTALPAAPRSEVPVQAAQPQKNKSIPAGAEIKTAPVVESIIQQIDKVLQAKLETSALKDRGIELTEGPGGIVIVKDGTNSYEGIDGIPDPQVKTLIRQAVSDWEKGSK
jgi:hypothetical protein